MKVVTAVCLLLVGTALTVGTWRWWSRRRRDESYTDMDRNLAIGLGGMGLLLVGAGIQLLIPG